MTSFRSIDDACDNIFALIEQLPQRGPVEKGSVEEVIDEAKATKTAAKVLRSVYEHAGDKPRRKDLQRVLGDVPLQMRVIDDNHDSVVSKSEAKAIKPWQRDLLVYAAEFERDTRKKIAYERFIPNAIQLDQSASTACIEGRVDGDAIFLRLHSQDVTDFGGFAPRVTRAPFSSAIESALEGPELRKPELRKAIKSLELFAASQPEKPSAKEKTLRQHAAAAAKMIRDNVIGSSMRTK